jgi:ubiquinol-cytochrome c reductase cytochrome c1 subunit
MIKQLLVAMTLVIAGAGPAPVVLAAESTYPLERAPQRQSDMVALQNGARLFVNFCVNCHSANVMRYNKLVDLGLTEDQIKDNLMFTTDKVGDLMNVAMRGRDARAWFGTAVPDLSVMARAKSINAGPSGADYIYTYLRTFYRDASRPSGWNNLVFPSVAMPHVMWAEQGPRELSATTMRQKPATDDGKSGDWERVTTVTNAQGYAQVKREDVPHYNGQAGVDYRFKAAQPQLAAAYDRDVADLTGFLTWMADPSQLERKRLGGYVLLFLGLFFVVAWRLNASYWKHVR